MNTADLIKQTRDLQERVKRYGGDSDDGNLAEAARAQTCEFLRIYSGPNSAFLKQAEAARGYSAYVVTTLDAILQSFVEYLTAGLATGTSPERRAQLDVVSDYLGQAHSLLEDDSHHPAAAAMVIGASLEEFLRTWVEAEKLSLSSAKPGIDAYMKCLRSAELITKQDVKDITSWAGIRNHAAHGDWNEVSDRGRIRLMLEGVNLFMRQKQEQR
ncbi:MAG TPA: hypothetical protein VNN08_25285 [Thermoanaerobaculia bacterium]|nr:hypothetical protein [Thermoanaerobaculia bacterium]